MFRCRLYNIFKLTRPSHNSKSSRSYLSYGRLRLMVTKFGTYKPITLAMLTGAYCEEKRKQVDVLREDENLEHGFLIRQSTTINVNAASQLLTVTLVAIQDTSERLRDALSNEICLIKQAMEWGEDGTPPQHWDQLVAIRGSLRDLNHNLHTLFSYMDYAEKLATAAAEISYLSGNIAASDAICERIDHACRTCNLQKQLTHSLQQESLELQKQAIVSSPKLQDKLKDDEQDGKESRKEKSNRTD